MTNADAPPPSNRDKSRDYFRWDPHHHQPHTDMSTREKLWASRKDVGHFVGLIGRTLRHLPAVSARYRELVRQPATPRRVGAHEFGLAISPTRESWPRYEERLRELGIRSVLIRIPSWDPGAIFDLRDEILRLHAEGFRFTFGLLQDRLAVTTPERWSSFVRSAAECFVAAGPTFQVGQALNRKKWGIWNPAEYLRLVEGVAAARSEFPGCHWIGPPVIDFEYHFTINFLFGPRPFDFDGVSSLLYVDRRGSPDSTQYGRFDLRKKILLLRAVVDASPLGRAPIHLTEFNWPIRGTGKHSPAGRDVQTTVEKQARYLVLYYLTAASTGCVADSFWWQMVAKGYGLLDDDEGWSVRRPYRALQEMVARVVGREIAPLPESCLPLRGWTIQGEGSTGVLVYTNGAPVPLALREGSVAAFDLEGNEMKGAGLVATNDPVWLDFDDAAPAELFGLLGSR